MNFKTTSILAIVLIGLGVLFYVSRLNPRGVEAEPEEARIPGTTAIAHEFIEEELGDVVKVVCKNKNGEEWVFEKQDAEGDRSNAWQMTSPFQMKAIPWEVQRFATQFDSLQYDISYKPGEPGAVSAKEAGLDPPVATVTLTNTEGQSVSIEIGKPESSTSTYARLTGSDEIRIAKVDLNSLLKARALDYGDQQLWRLDAKEIKRIEIVDRSAGGEPTTYVLARHGTQWMIESPVTAKATDKVDQLARSFSTLRVMKWQDHREDRLAMYGLKPAAITVRATVEKEVEIDDAEPNDAREPEAAEEGTSTEEKAAGEDAPESPKTRIETTTYVVHLSNRSPIGEETKVYVRAGDGAMTATLLKSTADKFMPAIPEWREMKLTSVDVKRASRVELSTPDGATTFVKAGDGWMFDGDRSAADAQAVNEILDTIKGLTAVVFVEMEAGDLSAFGLDQPQAQVRMTVPGVEDVETITVGGYTDADIKRMVYVRRNEVASIAKVRVADVEPLLRAPHAYRDRTVLNLDSSRVTRLALTAPNAVGDEPVHLEFQHDADGWKMLVPVDASIKADRVAELVEAAANLQADAIVADAAQRSAFGLHDPSVTLAITYQPPVEYRIEVPADKSDTSTADSPDEPEPLKPVKVQPPDETIVLSVNEHEGKVYALRGDNSPVFQLKSEFFNRLSEEFRTGDVLTFDETQVQAFSIQSGDATDTFEKQDGRWVYAAEPDLPLDPKKVDNLLLQLKDLRTRRYVAQSGVDVQAHGLDTPTQTVTVTLADGKKRVLRVSAQVCERDPMKGRYAAVADAPGVFLLTPDMVQRFKVSLDELEAD